MRTRDEVAQLVVIEPKPFNIWNELEQGRKGHRGQAIERELKHTQGSQMPKATERREPVSTVRDGSERRSRVEEASRGQRLH